MLLACKLLRTTPAFITAGIVFVSFFVNNAVEKIGFRLYGDATLTGRTGIWEFINGQIARELLVWMGFSFLLFRSKLPIKAAPGYVAAMPSSHSGYMELKLETGIIGYWIFMIFIYATLHYVGTLRNVAPSRTWFYLSVILFALLINLVDLVWVTLYQLWLLNLIVIAEVVRIRITTPEPDPRPLKWAGPKVGLLSLMTNRR